MTEHQKTVKTDDPPGFVVIDDKRFKISIGGIRLIQGVTQQEVELLAQAMSLKLHSFGLPMSGAKAGINSDEISDFYRFIAHPDVIQLIDGKDQQFITGPDIGTSEEEYYEALRKANLPHLIRKGLLSEISKEYGLIMDNIVTAWGAVVAMEEVMSDESSKDPLRNKKVILEGFGKVGTGIAKLLENRIKLVGISTRYGCIEAESENKYVKEGSFIIEEILNLQSIHGDNFIFHCGQAVKPVEALFHISADILVPGARTESINKHIAEILLNTGIQAIIPVANSPYTEEGLQILITNNIICFPDFIASAGAVIAAMIEFANAGGQQEAMDLVEAAIRYESKHNLKPNRYNVYFQSKKLALERRAQMLTNIADNLDIKTVAESIIAKYLPKLIRQNK